jgi:Putative Actinobacterial Holin-X, holin superfamily III
MEDKPTPPPFEQRDDAVDISPRLQVAELVSDVRNLAKAEWEYARARLTYSGGIMRKAGIYALLAIIALSGASIAFIVGTLLIIASYLGPWIATAITVLLFTSLAVLFALRARSTAKNLSFAERDDD